MKSIYRLLVMLGIACFCVNPAFAQDGGDYARQTRYVYLWDVTASTLSKDGSQFKKISEFLVRDIKSKPAGSDIKVVPFNDCVLVRDIEVVGANMVMDSLVNRGLRLADNHKKEWESNSNATSGLGYTNVASAIEYVKNHYISDGWNTIVILLTDGGQEYYDEVNHLAQRSKKPGANQQADDYLLGAIRELKYKIETAHSFNRLYYVVTTSEESDDPRKLDRSGMLTNCNQIKCIVASEGSINLYLPELEVKPVAANAISSRDDSFELKVSGLPNELLMQLDITIDAPAVGVNNFRCKVDRNNRIEVTGCDFAAIMGNKTDANFTMSMSLGKSDLEVGSDLYSIRFKNNIVSMQVTNDFRPFITVRMR